VSSFDLVNYITLQLCLSKSQEGAQEIPNLLEEEPRKKNLGVAVSVHRTPYKNHERKWS
jgi:hypothetical protein